MIIKRWVMLISGLLCFGIGIALMVQSHLGLGPWDVLHQGITNRTGIPLGTISIFVSVPVLMLAWVLGQRPGWGTVVNMVLVGATIDLASLVLPSTDNLALRAVLLVGGILVIGFGSGLYLNAALGAGARDGLMIGLARRTGLSVRTTRTLIEVVVLVFGWLLGGTVGVGTLAFAFGIGPVVQLALRVLGAPTEAPALAAENLSEKPFYR